MEEECGEYMWDGYWINYEIGKAVCIGLKGDHARWISDIANATELGVGESGMAKACKYDPVHDRDKFLLAILRASPVMRIRGHGVYVTAEFDSKTVVLPYIAVNEFAQKYLVPVTMFHVVNWAYRPPRVRDIYALLLEKYVEKRGWTDQAAKRQGQGILLTVPASPSLSIQGKGKKP